MENDLPERTYQYGRRVIHLFESLPQTKLAQHRGFQLLWLRHIADSELIAPQRLDDLRQETDELIRIFVPIIKRARGD